MALHIFLIHGVIKGEIQTPLICQQYQTIIVKLTALDIYANQYILNEIMRHLHI